MADSIPMIPIYSSQGEVGAVLVYPNLFNQNGEWIGWVSAEREVFSVYGHYVGWISDEPRILRTLGSNRLIRRHVREQPPERIAVPAMFPLAPLLPELPTGTIDVLEKNPELLPPLDFGDLSEDLDH